MIRVLLIAILIGLGAITADAREAARIEVYEFGTYAAVGPAYRQPPSPQGIKIETHESYVHRETTRTIVAQLGVRFGFRYKTIGNGRDYVVPLKMVWTFPPPGLIGRDPQKPVRREVVALPAVSNGSSALIMSLESPSDLVPGTWTIEIWSGNLKLAEEKFEIVMPLIS
jgi:hypothetical protein